MLAGRSASVAVAVKVSEAEFSHRSAVADGASTGATLTSLTVTVMLGVARWGGRIVTDLDGEGIAAGTLGFGGRPGEDTRRVVMLAPVGTVPVRLKVRGWAGRSVSVAVAVKVSRPVPPRCGCRWRPDRGDIDFANGDSDQFGVAQWGGRIVADLDGEGDSCRDPGLRWASR